MGVLVGLEPEGRLEREMLLQLVEELPRCVDLFSHQWFLIHGSTPFAGSVMAWSSSSASDRLLRW
jgi:hypothetical protein